MEKKNHGIRLKHGRRSTEKLLSRLSGRICRLTILDQRQEWGGSIAANIYQYLSYDRLVGDSTTGRVLQFPIIREPEMSDWVRMRPCDTLWLLVDKAIWQVSRR